MDFAIGRENYPELFTVPVIDKVRFACIMIFLVGLEALQR